MGDITTRLKTLTAPVKKCKFKFSKLWICSLPDWRLTVAYKLDGLLAWKLLEPVDTVAAAAAAAAEVQLVDMVSLAHQLVIDWLVNVLLLVHDQQIGKAYNIQNERVELKEIQQFYKSYEIIYLILK